MTSHKTASERAQQLIGMKQIAGDWMLTLDDGHRDGAHLVGFGKDRKRARHVRDLLREAWADQIAAAEATAIERCAVVMEDWGKYYSEGIFPAPPPKQHGETVDQCSAAMGRQLCKAAAEKLRALSPARGGEGE